MGINMLKYFLLIGVTVSADELIADLPASQYAIFISISFCLVCFAGAMSGLTVGLMSIDALELEMKIASGTEEDKRMANKVLGVIKNHHLLLVTLLLANAFAMETLPLLLDRMFSEILSVIISVTFVLIFGEVIPQALCVGPNQLKIASKMVPLVKFVLIVFFPISWPIAKCLDCVLGSEEETHRFKIDELKTLLDLHAGIPTGDEPHGSTALYGGQLKIIHGALDIAKNKVRDFMVHEDLIFSISEDSIFDRELIDNILHTGYSRVPVHEKNFRDKIRGILYVKSLLGIKKNTPLKKATVSLKSPVYIHPDNTLYDLMEILKQKSSNLALVTEDIPLVTITVQQQDSSNSVILEDTPRVIGLISLQDVVDELLKGEFKDRASTDNFQLAIDTRKSEVGRTVNMRSTDAHHLLAGRQSLDVNATSGMAIGRLSYKKVVAGRPVTVRFGNVPLQGHTTSTDEYTRLSDSIN
jgi:metal transporter CNNM